MSASKTAKAGQAGTPTTGPKTEPARTKAPNPAAGAHAAAHLTNEDATPGSGALPSHAHASGKDVDGGAG